MGRQGRRVVPSWWDLKARGLTEAEAHVLYRLALAVEALQTGAPVPDEAEARRRALAEEIPIWA